MGLRYVIGDATQPRGRGNKVIVHVCNDRGLWGRGFVLEVSARWPQPERAYKCWSTDWERFPIVLGSVQFVAVEYPEKDIDENRDFLFVANVIGQHDILAHGGVAPVRYPAIAAALEQIATFTKSIKASVHMPRIGCGLAGGSWKKIEPIVKEKFDGLRVVVYDFHDSDAPSYAWANI